VCWFPPVHIVPTGNAVGGSCIGHAGEGPFPCWNQFSVGATVRLTIRRIGLQPSTVPRLHHISIYRCAPAPSRGCHSSFGIFCDFGMASWRAGRASAPSVWFAPLTLTLSTLGERVRVRGIHRCYALSVALPSPSNLAAPLVSGSYGSSHWMTSIRFPSGSATKKRSAPGIGVVSWKATP
jgi:hypothetical protein